MILAIIFAQVWGVIQLIVLTSLARTVRVRTVLAAMAVGFYAIGPVTAFLQLSWIRIAALVLAKSVGDLTGVASYTVDPFLEEAMKLLPLLMLMLIPAIRRQWSITDCLLIAAATGSGFGLAEHLFRYADYASTAQSVSGGYAMTIGSATPLVPGIARTLTSWIPLGVFFESNAVRVNWHLAWSALGGLAVGLFLRYPKKATRLTAVGLLLLTGLDHAAGNAPSIQYTWLAWLAAPLRFLDGWLGLLVLVAIVVVWWLDQPSQRTGVALGPLLAAEQTASSRLAGTLTAALSRLPRSIPWVFGFDRARRAYHAAHAAAPESTDVLRDHIIAQRDSIDRKLAQPIAVMVPLASWTLSAMRARVLSAVRRPSVVIWLVLITPSVLYLIIGGFPAASGLQAVMKGPVVWPVVLLITLFSQGRQAWRVLAGIRRLPATARLPIGDDAAMLALQVASGLGTLSLAGFTFAHVLSGVGAGERMLSTAHAADAMNRTQPAGGATIAGSGGAFDPPPPSPALPGEAAAGDASSSDTSGDDGPPPDPPTGEEPGRDTSKRIEAGYEAREKYEPLSKDEGGTDEVPAPKSTTAPGPTMTHVSQAEVDAAVAKSTAPTTMTHVSQAEVDAAVAKAAAPSTSGGSPAPAPATGGGVFDPPPPTVDLPHDATTTPGDSAATKGPKGGGGSGTVGSRKKP